MQAAVVAAVAAAANAGHQYPVRPVNVHSAKINSNCSRLMNTPSLCSNPIPRNVNALSSDLTVSDVLFIDKLLKNYYRPISFNPLRVSICLLFSVRLAFAEFRHGLYVAYSSSTTSVR